MGAFENRLAFGQSKRDKGLRRERNICRPMDRQEARTIIIQELEAYRAKEYSELAGMIDAEPITYDRTGPSGVEYQIEMMALWDGKKGGDVRVMGNIDDGGWSAYSPLTEDFIKASDGSFVGE